MQPWESFAKPAVPATLGILCNPSVGSSDPKLIGKCSPQRAARRYIGIIITEMADTPYQGSAQDSFPGVFVKHGRQKFNNSAFFIFPEPLIS